MCFRLLSCTLITATDKGVAAISQEVYYDLSEYHHWPAGLTAWRSILFRRLSILPDSDRYLGLLRRIRTWCRGSSRPLWIQLPWDGYRLDLRTRGRPGSRCTGLLFLLLCRRAPGSISRVFAGHRPHDCLRPQSLELPVRARWPHYCCRAGNSDRGPQPAKTPDHGIHCLGRSHSHAGRALDPVWTNQRAHPAIWRRRSSRQNLVVLDSCGNRVSDLGLFGAVAHHANVHPRLVRSTAGLSKHPSGADRQTRRGGRGADVGWGRLRRPGWRGKALTGLAG